MSTTELKENDIILQIVYMVKHNQDYKQAATLMANNDISLDTLSEKTIKLNQIDLAKLADEIIESRR